MDTVIESLLLFGRPSLGAAIGLAVGSITQGERHVRWALLWALAGFSVGALAMLPAWREMVIAYVLVMPAFVGAFIGLVTGAGTLGERDDWYLRSWGFLGFVGSFHVLGIVAVVLLRWMDE